MLNCAILEPQNEETGTEANEIYDHADDNYLETQATLDDIKAYKINKGLYSTACDKNRYSQLSKMLNLESKGLYKNINTKHVEDDEDYEKPEIDEDYVKVNEKNDEECYLEFDGQQESSTDPDHGVTTPGVTDDDMYTNSGVAEMSHNDLYLNTEGVRETLENLYLNTEGVHETHENLYLNTESVHETQDNLYLNYDKGMSPMGMCKYS